jgi:hypothetical protein
MRLLVKQVDPVDGEMWTMHLYGLEDEVLAVSRRQLVAVRQALSIST